MPRVFGALAVALALTAHSSSARASTEENSGVRALVGPSYVWMKDGEAATRGGYAKNGVGFDITILASAGSRLQIGLGLSTNFWTAPAPDNGTAQAMGFQILPTAVYALENSPTAALRPYIGLSIGPMVSALRTIRNGWRGDRDYLFSLAAFARPGIAWAVSRALSLHVEAKIGVMASNFAVAPQLTLAFPFEAGHNR